MKFKLVVLVLFVLVEMTQAFIADSIYFGGLEISNNLRRGYFKLSEGHEQKQQLNNMTMYGFSIGKRFRLNDYMRVQVPLTFDYGKADEDTVQSLLLNDGTSTSAIRQSEIFHLAINPDLQFPLNVAPESRIIISAGTGVHFIRYLEQEIMAGQSQVKISDPYLENGFKVTVSGSAGVGFETLMSRQFGISVMYTFRYWEPVSYKTQRDLFPTSPVDYSQVFFTHQISISILLNRNPY